MLLQIEVTNRLVWALLCTGRTLRILKKITAVQVRSGKNSVSASRFKEHCSKTILRMERVASVVSERQRQPYGI
jgi:hypothetical protein